MKVKVGNDEFCSNCMDWQEYDPKGRCIVCGKVIKKKIPRSYIKSYDEYQQDDSNEEVDNEFYVDNE